MSGEPSIIRFDGFELDTGKGRLSRHGEEIKLRPKCFSVLVHLVTNHGRLVSKIELFDAIWPGRVVTDDSLTQCLIEIRRAIGDEDRTKIRTVSRRGYIFEAPLEEVDGLGSSSPPREARILGTGRVAAVSLAMMACLIAGWIILSSETTEPCCNGLEVPISIFVPPITTNGIETPDGDLLRTEVVRRLSKIAIFRVLDETPATGREHADFHVAASLVDTEPATAGIRLVRLNDGEILWSESFMWEPGQQTNIAERLARAMKVYLDPRIVQEARSSSRALDPHALSAYLDGLVEMDNGTPEAYERAISYFDTAIRLDPDFAAAYRSKAVGYGFLSAYRQVDGEEILGLWMRSKALEPNHPGTQLGLIGVHHAMGDLEAASSAMQKLRATYPSFRNIGVAEFLAQCGHTEDALAIVDHIIEEDSEAIWPKYLKIKFLWVAGRHREALSVADRILAITPNDRLARLNRSRVLESLGRLAEAVESLPPELGHLKDAFQDHGVEGLRQAELEQAQAIHEGRGPPGARQAWQYFVRVYAALGEPEQAVRWLAEGYENDRYEFLWYRQFPFPGMQEVRSHPSFRRLMADTVGNPESCPAADQQITLPQAGAA